MKERRTADFPVTITEENWQHETSPELYEGIYSVECNRRVTIMFVPDFRTEANWPPTVDLAGSLDWDAAPDAGSARWMVAVTSRIVVTPHDGATRIETFDTSKLWLLDEPYESRTALISIRRELFASLVDEMRALLERHDGIRWHAYGGGGVPISELEHTDLVRFLRAHVLLPTILSPSDLHLLALDG